MLETYVGFLAAYLTGKTAWTLFWSFVAFRRQKKSAAEQREQLAVVAKAFEQYQAQQETGANRAQVPDDPPVAANAS